jgi:hypothetical protein
MQGGSKENNNNNTSSRRWTPEDRTRIVMESLTTKHYSSRTMQKVPSQSKCVLQLETEIHRRW